MIAGELEYQVNAHNDLKLNVDTSSEIVESTNRGGDQTKTYTDRTGIGLEHKGSYGDFNTVARISTEKYEQDNTTPSELDVILSDAQIQFPAFEGSHFFIFGGEFQKYDLDYEGSNGAGSFTTSLNQISLFAEDSIQISEKNTLTLGARNTHHSRFKDHLTPRVYLNHKASEELSFKAGVGTGYKAPSLFQLSKDFEAPSCGDGSCTVVGNPDLKPEKSVTYELGAIWAKDKWNTSVTLFYSELSDMINFYEITTPERKERRYHNIENASSQGVELSASYQASASLFLRLNFTYTDAENKTAHTPLTNTPNSTGNLLADWAFKDDMSAYFALNYTGERDVQIGRSGEFIKAKPYSLLNAGYTYQFAPTASLTIGVENITNKLLDKTIYSYGELGRRYFSKLSYTF